MEQLHFLTEASNCRIYRQGEQIILKKTPASWLGTAKFVMFVLCLIPFGAGILMLVSALRGSPEMLWPGVILTGFSCIFGGAFYLLLKYDRKIKKLPPDALVMICSIDLKNCVLLDSSGQLLDTLDNVSIERSMQVTSSSKKLVIKWSKGKLIIAHGNPFTGGTEPLEEVLRSHGLMK